MACWQPELEQGVVPPGRYAGQTRSPIVYVRLCAVCAGFAPITAPDYEGFLSGKCQGCGIYCREVHRFPAYIHTIGGCATHDCSERHAVRVVGDMDHRQSPFDPVAVRAEVGDTL